jgi:hypothetical protein
MTIILGTILFVTRIINNYIDHNFKKRKKYKLGINWLLILIRSSCLGEGGALRIG